jgi:predicted carbohydrate-binding protein with CBM5 and CBM33 domain
MKVTKIALATAFALTSTVAMAQNTGLEGHGSVVAPSVGSYQTTVGSSNVVPTWQNTQGTAATKKPKTSAVIQNPSGRMSGGQR